MFVHTREGQEEDGMGDAGTRAADQVLAGEMRRARAAQASWALTSVRDRVQRARRLSRLIAERADRLAEIISTSMGKTLVDAVSTEAVPAALAASYYARIAPRMLKPRVLRRSSILFFNKVSTLTRVPFGVVAVISPWNYPLGIPFHEIVPALLAGNAVLFKPAARTIAVGEAILDLVRDAGFPDALLQLVRLPGEVATEALLAAGVDKIFFTGSSASGKEVMAKAAERLVPVVLELGGSDAMIVLDDANIERAAAGALWAGMSNAGQSCAGVQRVFVDEAVWDSFIARLREKTGKLHVGADPGFDTDVGGMAAPGPRARVDEVLRIAKDRGARVVAHAGTADGLVHPVVILEESDTVHELMQEEVFGPVIVLARVHGEDEAVERANDSPYGLSASVWSRSRPRARRIAERLRVGSVTINDHLMSHGMAETPWGGFGWSGIGRSHGEIGFDEMTQPRAIVDDRLHRTPRAMWWYPYDRSLYEGMKGVLVALYGRGLVRRVRGAGRLLRAFMRSFHG
jgi:acyl-CoA reductase-like NAD-dependent aldehyde dehydrogenase